MPQTTEKKDKGTEKQVHDLTKRENVSNVIDQSLRSLHEMERRLVAMEAEFARITGRQPTSPYMSAGAGDPSRTSSPNALALGARSPQDQGAASGSLFSHGAPQQGAFGASSPHGAPQQGPFGAPSPFGVQASPFLGAPSPSGVPPSFFLPPGVSAPPFGLPGLGAPGFFQGNPAAFPALGMSPFAPSPFASPFSGAAPFGAPRFGPQGQQAPVAIGADPNQAGIAGQAPVQGGAESSLFGGALGAMGEGMTRTRDLADMPPQVRQPSMDVFDEGKEFIIHVELPGVKKDDLDIMVTERALVLNAKIRPESDLGVVVHSERPPVLYRRNVMLGAEVDTANAKANLKDGVLTVRVPKTTPANGPRQLDVAYG